jgi:acyl carrier protein
MEVWMGEETVKECLITALCLDETEAQQVRPETTADDLQKWDSVAQLMLVTQLEERFGVEFSDEELLQLTSVDAILRIVTGKQR